MFYDKIEKLCNESGISVSKLGELLPRKVSRSAISAWRRGIIPHEATIRMISDYFNVDPDWLISDENDELPMMWTSPKASDDYMPLTSMEKQLLDIFRGVSEIGRMRIASAALKVYDIEFNGDPDGDK